MTLPRTPITVEQAWANGFSFSLTLPYSPTEYHMLWNAVASLNRGGRSWALVQVSNADGEGVEIWLKQGSV